MKNLLLIMLSLLASGSLYAMTDGDSEKGSKEYSNKSSSNEEHEVNALALGADEGRG